MLQMYLIAFVSYLALCGVDRCDPVSS